MNTVSALQPGMWLDANSARPVARARPAARDTGTAGGKKLCCRGCRRVITDESQRVSIAGDHAHTRSNPQGVTFCFGCFAGAPGCSSLGRATAEHTWFAGCAWQIAVCGGCGDHLGWRFTGAHHFFGLILDRLVAEAGGTA